MLTVAGATQRVTTAAARRWVACIVGTAVISAVLMASHVSAAFLIGALIAAGASALVGRRELVPSKYLLRPAQGIVGVAAAAPLAAVTVHQMAGYLGVSLACIALTLVICLGCAYWLWKLAESISPATAVLSTLAGGASGISTMAPELNVDHRYVALSQYLRLIVVTLTLPLVLMALPAIRGGSTETIESGPALLAMAVIGVLALVPGYLGRRVRLPAPFLLTPLLVTVIITVVGQGTHLLDVPPYFTDFAYIIIGWQAGGAFARSSVTAFLRLLPVTCVFIATAIAGCFAMAVLVSAWTGTSLSESYLATTPGGIYAVLAVAHDSGSGPLVTTLQVLRLLAMLVVAILASRFLGRRAGDGRTEGGIGVSRTTARETIQVR